MYFKHILLLNLRNSRINILWVWKQFIQSVRQLTASPPQLTLRPKLLFVRYFSHIFMYFTVNSHSLTCLNVRHIVHIKWRELFTCWLLNEINSLPTKRTEDFPAIFHEKHISIGWFLIHTQWHLPRAINQRKRLVIPHSHTFTGREYIIRVLGFISFPDTSTIASVEVPGASVPNRLLLQQAENSLFLEPGRSRGSARTALRWAAIEGNTTWIQLMGWMSIALGSVNQIRIDYVAGGYSASSQFASENRRNLNKTHKNIVYR